MSRSRLSSDRIVALLGSGPGTLGGHAADHWLTARGGTAPTHRWHVEIALDVIPRRAPSEFDETIASRFQIDIYAEEWGVYVCHAGAASWIRVANIASVHERDDLRLLGVTPQLKDIGWLLRHVEKRFGLEFQRDQAHVRTNLTEIEPAVRSWLLTL